MSKSLNQTPALDRQELMNNEGTTSKPTKTDKKNIDNPTELSNPPPFPNDHQPKITASNDHMEPAIITEFAQKEPPTPTPAPSQYLNVRFDPEQQQKQLDYSSAHQRARLERRLQRLPAVLSGDEIRKPTGSLNGKGVIEDEDEEMDGDGSSEMLEQEENAEEMDGLLPPSKDVLVDVPPPVKQNLRAFYRRHKFICLLCLCLHVFAIGITAVVLTVGIALEHRKNANTKANAAGSSSNMSGDIAFAEHSTTGIIVTKPYYSTNNGGNGVGGHSTVHMIQRKEGYSTKPNLVPNVLKTISTTPPPTSDNSADTPRFAIATDLSQSDTTTTTTSFGFSLEECPNVTYSNRGGSYEQEYDIEYKTVRIQPEIYHLMLEFKSSKKSRSSRAAGKKMSLQIYKGRMTVDLIVTEDEAREFSLNVNRNTVWVFDDDRTDWSSAALYQKITGESLLGERICFRTIQLLGKDQLRFRLSEPLIKGARYRLELPSFTVAESVTTEASESESDEHHQAIIQSHQIQQSHYYLLWTNFQLRQARTVFPCFDHPALKAKFQLCLRYPKNKNLDAVSSSPKLVNNSTKSIFEGCSIRFEPTPPISPHSLSFAIFNSGMRQIMPPKDDDRVHRWGRGIRLIIDGSSSAAAAEETDFDWVLKLGNQVIKFMKRLTKAKSPFGTINLLVIPAGNEAADGVSNAGFIVLSGRILKDHDLGAEKRYRARKLIVQNIVKQWMGNSVTIKEWSEICLQEGLTDLLTEFLMSIDQDSIWYRWTSYQRTAEDVPKVELDGYDVKTTKKYAKEILTEKRLSRTHDVSYNVQIQA